MPALLPILRSEAQGRLFAQLAAHPDREWTVRGLARELGLTHVTVGRELDRAEQAGIVSSRRDGRNRLVRFDPTHPLARPLREILLATFGAPQTMLRKLRESLKPEGRLVLVEYKKEDPTIPINPTHKMSVAEAKLEVEAEGFTLTKVSSELPRQHVLIFTRR